MLLAALMLPLLLSAAEAAEEAPKVGALLDDIAAQITIESGYTADNL